MPATARRWLLLDLPIAACAHHDGAAVLHLDRHYDTLAKVLTFAPIRLE